MKTTVHSELDEHDDEWLFESNQGYPDGYTGQELSHRYVFVPQVSFKMLHAKRKSMDAYLTVFAKEVAAGESERASQYLKAYPFGQRFLWTFPDDEFVLLSLVALLPEGPRPVMWLGHGNSICDAQGNLLHHAELITRWSIETMVGTSTHP